MRDRNDRPRRELELAYRQLLEPIEFPALMQNSGDDPRLGDAFDEIVEHHPLIMPVRCGAPQRPVPALCPALRSGRRPHVEFEEGQMRLGNDEISSCAWSRISAKPSDFLEDRCDGPSDAAGTDIDGLADQEFWTGRLPALGPRPRA